MPFAHENLGVYQLALDFLVFADEVVERVAGMVVNLAKAQDG